MSSSAITKILIQGPTGSIGPIGARGPTGPTGSTGSTGATGSRGRYLTSLNFSDNGTTLTAVYTDEQNSEDSVIQEISGSFRGITLIDQTAGIVLGASSGVAGTIGLFLNVGGGTFNLRGLCAYGSLRASLTGANNEYISIDSIYYGLDVVGNYSPGTFTSNNMTYLGTPTTVYGANLKLNTNNGTQGVCGSYEFLRTEIPATTFHLNSGARIKTLGPIKKNSVLPGGNGSTGGLFIDANTGGAFILKTPIGIRGISGSFKVNEIASLTLLVESDDVWNFPSNVLFEEDENYLSCGKNIIGLFTYDGGVTWKARVSHRGHGIQNDGTVIGVVDGRGNSFDSECIPGYLYGSCCYNNIDDTLDCLDYTTRGVCDRLFGNFNPGLPCDKSCGVGDGICCTNGECVPGVSVTQCDLFGGSYWSNTGCSGSGTLNFPFPTNRDASSNDILREGRFCYDSCSTEHTVCCKDGECLGNYTRIQCELILGGKSMTGATCGDVDCCDHTTTPGACCRSSGCIQQSYENCVSDGGVSDGGVYMGPGTQCEDVNCDCIVLPGGTGSCCYNNLCGGICEDNISSAVCSSYEGIFDGVQTCLERIASDECISGIGATGACALCLNGTYECRDNILVIQCFGEHSTPYEGLECNDLQSTKCIPHTGVEEICGACCHIVDGEKRCVEGGITYCRDELRGTYHPGVDCTKVLMCGTDTVDNPSWGICCDNGICENFDGIQNTYIDCACSGGSFERGVKCEWGEGCDSGCGACCFIDAAGDTVCHGLVPIQDCIARGGQHHRNRNCDMVVCNVTNKLKPCCINGVCSPKTETDCSNAGGITVPNTTDCEGVNCTLGTCCCDRFDTLIACPEGCVEGVTELICTDIFLSSDFNPGETVCDIPAGGSCSPPQQRYTCGTNGICNGIDDGDLAACPPLCTGGGNCSCTPPCGNGRTCLCSYGPDGCVSCACNTNGGGGFLVGVSDIFYNILVDLGGITYCIPVITKTDDMEICPDSEIS